jgi:hypothetical protein
MKARKTSLENRQQASAKDFDNNREHNNNKQAIGTSSLHHAVGQAAGERDSS